MALGVIAHLTEIGVSGKSGVLFIAAVLALLSSTFIIYVTRNRIELLGRMFNAYKSEPKDPS